MSAAIDPQVADLIYRRRALVETFREARGPEGAYCRLIQGLTDEATLSRWIEAERERGVSVDDCGEACGTLLYALEVGLFSFAGPAVIDRFTQAALPEPAMALAAPSPLPHGE